PLRPAVPRQPRPPAADRRGDRVGAAQDPPRLGQPVARARPGAARMSEAGTVLVTGGSGGIGAAIARAMLERGYRVVSLALEKPDWAHPNLEAKAVDLSDARATA